MRACLWLVSVVVGLAAAGSAPAQQADTTALKKQREQIAQQVRQKHKELSELRAAAMKSERLAPLQKQVGSAFKAVIDKERADPEVQAAAKALDEANKALRAIVSAEVSANRDGKALLKEIDELSAKLKAAQQKLDEVRRKVTKDSGKVAAAGEAAKKAAEAHRAAAAKRTAAERAAHDKARAVLDAKAAELFNADPKAAALRKAIDELTKKDRELVEKIRELERPGRPKAEPKDKPKDRPREKAKSDGRK